MRRAQLLSLDAMLSLIIMIFVFAAVVNTSAALKGEITSMLGWYERANIADNMLDVLTKSPGDPVDWENNPVEVRVLGLRENGSFGISYAKIAAMNEHASELLDKFTNLSLGKDFLILTYISKFRVGIKGRFPKIYIDNMTFSNPRGNPPGINFQIAGNENGDTPITVSYIEIVRDGTRYVNEGICDLKTGNNIVFQEGDIISFILADTATLSVKRGKYSYTKTLPAGTFVKVYITGPESSKFKITFDSCPYSFKFTGHGNVVVTVSAYDSTVPEITANYTYASELMERREPTYYFAVINGSLIRDMNLIEKSKNSSPWVEVAQRRVIVERFEYNLSGGPSAERPIVYGVLDGRLPQNTQLLISVPAGKGNLTIVILSGSNERGLMVYREDVDEPVKAVLVRDNTTTSYEGNSTTIGIPMKDLVEDETKAPLGIWLYSVSGWDREDIEISIVPSIRWSLKPKFEEGVLKLVVWDDG